VRLSLCQDACELGFGIAKRILSPLALGDVSQDDRVEAFPADIEFGYRGLGGKFLTILASCNHFLPLAHAARNIRTRCEAFDVLLMGPVKSGWNKNIDGLAEHLGRRVAKHSFCCLVEDADPKQGIDGHDRVAGNRQDAGELGLGIAKRILGPLARADDRPLGPNSTKLRIEPMPPENYCDRLNSINQTYRPRQ